MYSQYIDFFVCIRLIKGKMIVFPDPIVKTEYGVQFDFLKMAKI